MSKKVAVDAVEFEVKGKKRRLHAIVDKTAEQAITEINNLTEKLINLFKPDTLDSEIRRATNDYIRNNPDSVSTVEPNTVGKDKLTGALRTDLAYASTYATLAQGASISPIYKGDYLSQKDRYLPSCCIRTGTKLYCIDAPQNNWAINHSSNVGSLITVDLTTNTVVSKSPIECSHANSIAFDGTYYYVAPIYDYSKGAADTVRYLYRYNSDWSNASNPTKITVPNVFMSVAYDHATNKLYGFVGPGTIYEYVNSTWKVAYIIDRSTITNTTNSGVTSNYYNQDFAIYNGYAYISSPGGMVYCFDIRNNNGIFKFFTMARTDILNRYFLGELEGWEFDENGHLYATTYINLNGNSRNAIIVEIPTIHSSPYIEDEWTFSRVYETTMSSAIQNKFYLKPTELRAINQIQIMQQPPTLIFIDGDYKEIDCGGETSITKDMTIHINGTWELTQMRIMEGHLKLYAGSDVSKIYTTSDSTPIFFKGTNGRLTICGDHSLTFKKNNYSSNRIITVDYYMPEIYIRTTVLLDNGEIPTISDRPIYLPSNGGSYFIGSSMFAPGNMVTGVTDVISTVPNGYVDITIQLPANAFSWKVPNITASFIAESTNVNYSHLQLSIHNVSRTSFKVRVYNNSASVLKPVLSWMAYGL